MIWKLQDSWYHYRRQCKLGFWHAAWRTLYYETFHKEPWYRPMFRKASHMDVLDRRRKVIDERSL